MASRNSARAASDGGRTHAAGESAFASTLMELSGASRRWKFEATCVLAAELRELEAKLAAAETELKLLVETRAAMQACEDRAAVERKLLRRALHDAEDRASFFEIELKRVFAVLQTAKPPDEVSIS